MRAETRQSTAAAAGPPASEPPPPKPNFEPEDRPKKEPTKPEAFLARQRQLGSLGGKCAGSVGENKFLVEVAVDGRARCQLRTCKEPLKIGELRLGKRPPSRPVGKSILHEVVMNRHRHAIEQAQTRRNISFPPRSLRHGHNPKVTWYHPECAMKAFLACSAKSRVVEKVEDIDHGWDALSDTNKAFIRSIIDGAPKSQAPRKIQRKPSPPTENQRDGRELVGAEAGRLPQFVARRLVPGENCERDTRHLRGPLLGLGHAARPFDVQKALAPQGLRLRLGRPLGAESPRPGPRTTSCGRTSSPKVRTRAARACTGRPKRAPTARRCTTCSTCSPNQVTRRTKDSRKA